MDLLVQTCHRLGALATGGMAALLLPRNTGSDSYRRVLASVTRLESKLQMSVDSLIANRNNDSSGHIFSERRLKLLEIKAGVDGFMVYDLNLIEPMQKASTG